MLQGISRNSEITLMLPLEVVSHGPRCILLLFCFVFAIITLLERKHDL